MKLEVAGIFDDSFKQFKKLQYPASSMKNNNINSNSQSIFLCNKHCIRVQQTPGKLIFYFFPLQFPFIPLIIKASRISPYCRYISLISFAGNTWHDYGFFSLWNSIVGYFSELAIYCRCYIAIFTSIGKRT